MDEHLLAAIWLQMLLGYGSKRAGRILQYFGSPLEAYRERLSPEMTGLLQPKQIQRAKELTLNDAEPTLNACTRHKIQVLSWEDEAFPAPLAELPDPPAAIYLTGNAQALQSGPKVGMIGSRRPSAYGVRVCAEIGGQLAKAGAVLVSGLADGLDSEAHKASVEAGQPTIAILGTPIQQTYPTANQGLRRQIEEGNGTVISEYGPLAAGGKSYFLLRNRLIAGLSDALCVVEAREQSGTLHTVDYAEGYGRPIYAVPGNVFSPLSQGTNELIAQGRAKILRGAQPLLQELGMEPEQPSLPGTSVAALSATAKRLLNILGDAPLGIDAICAAGALPTGAVLSALTELELAGQLEALPGRQYRLR